MKTAAASLSQMIEELSGGAHKVPSNMSQEQWNHQLQSEIPALISSSKALYSLAGQKSLSRSQLDSASRELTQQADKIMISARGAALSGTPTNYGLINAAKAVADSLKNMVYYCDIMSENPDQSSTSKDALALAYGANAAATKFLEAALKGNLADSNSQDLIIESARVLAASVQNLLEEMQANEESISDSATRSAVQSASQSLRNTSEMLVATANGLASGALLPECRAQINSACKSTSSSVSHLVLKAKETLDSNAMESLVKVAKDVSDAMKQLLNATECAEGQSPDLPEMRTAQHELRTALAGMKQSVGNKNAIIGNTKSIAASTNQIVTVSKSIAVLADDTTRNRLLAAAKAAADAVAELVNRAKLAATNPHDLATQRHLVQSTEKLGERADELVEESGRLIALAKIRQDAKNAAAVTSALVATARMVKSGIGDSNMQMQLLQASKEAADAMAALVQQLKLAGNDATNEELQKKLVEVARKCSVPAMGLVATSKHVMPRIADLVQKSDLKLAADRVAEALQQMINTCKMAQRSGEADVEEAIELIAAAVADLDTTEFAVNSGMLQPIPGQSRNDTLALLNMAMKQLGGSINRLQSNAGNSKQLGATAKDTGHAVGQMATAVKSVASTTADKSVQGKMVQSAKDLTHEAEAMIMAAKAVASNPGQIALQKTLLEAAQKVAAELANLTAASRGFDSRILDEVVKLVLAQVDHVKPSTAPSSKDLASCSEELASNSKALSAAISQVAAMAKSNPENLGSAAKITGSTVPSLVQSSNDAAALSSNSAVGEKISEDTRGIITKTATMLNYAKATAASSDSSNDAQLEKSVKDVHEALQALLRSIGASSNADCEEAITMIMEATASLDVPSGTSGKNIYDSLQDLTDKVRSLASSTSQLVNAARGTPDQLGGAAKGTAGAVERVVKATRDTMSADTGPPIPKEYAELSKTIIDSQRALIESSGDTPSLFANARSLANATSQLVAIAKREAATLVNPEQQQNILKCAQTLSTATSTFAKAAKAMQMKLPGASEQLLVGGRNLEEATAQLIEALLPDIPKSSISPEAIKKLSDAVRGVNTATAQLISAAADVSNKPKDNSAQTHLSAVTKSVTDSIGNVLRASSAMQPGFAEVEEAVDTIQSAVGELDATSISVAVGSFEGVHTLKSQQECQEVLVQVAKRLATAASEVNNASRMESPEAVGRAAKEVGKELPKLVDACKETVSTTSDQDAQNSLLSLAKDMADALLQQVQAARIASVNPTNEAHKEVSDKFKDTTDAIGQLAASLKSGVILLKEIDEAIKVIDDARSKLDEPLTPTSRSYQEAKGDLSDLSKVLGGSVKRLIATDKSNLLQLGSASQQIAENVPRIVDASRDAATSIEDTSLRDDILSSTSNLANATRSLVQATKEVASDPKNKTTHQRQTECFKTVTKALTELLSAAKRGAVGEIMCDEALDSINASITQLDAASLFAAAGQLEAEDPTVNAADCQKEMLTAAKATAAAASQLVQSTKSSQKQFGTSAKNTSDVIGKLADSSKSTAALMGDTKAQQAILAATKAAAICARQLVLAGKDVQRFKEDPDAQKALMKGAESVAEAVQSLISLSQNAEAEVAKGLQELTTAKRQLQESLSQFDSPSHNPPEATPDHIVKAARQVASASAQLAASPSNQEAIASASQATASACRQLLDISAAAANTSDNPQVKESVRNTAKASVEAMSALLDAVKDCSKTGLGHQEISANSTAVADGISELISAARNLPGGSGLKLEEDTGKDLEEMASQELAAAARVIEEAATSLLAAKPQKKESSIGFDTSDITAAIFDAAVAIANTAKNLVQAAGRAQSDRVDNQKNNPSIYKKDPMWANGLISAAKQVAGATQQLVVSANNAVQGKAQEEELVAVARSVAAATAQLVAASRAKADPQSQTHQTLSQAAKTVASATSQLVSAAKAYADAAEEEEEEEMAANYTGAAVKQLEHQMKIARLEKELEKARKSMFNSRKKEYQQ